mmetsp:Transcript_1477/g.3594  ORF Transcript_1477/g.3594 Transcript_1477/m.3594 type:complete len:147 (+) Transcript_1477:361-801(+)
MASLIKAAVRNSVMLDVTSRSYQPSNRISDCMHPRRQLGHGRGGNNTWQPTLTIGNRAPVQPRRLHLFFWAGNKKSGTCQEKQNLDRSRHRRACCTSAASKVKTVTMVDRDKADQPCHPKAAAGQPAAAPRMLERVLLAEQRQHDI